MTESVSDEVCNGDVAEVGVVSGDEDGGRRFGGDVEGCAVSTNNIDLQQPAGHECLLPPHLQEKALRELQEKPEWRARDIQALRDIIHSQAPSLFARTDDPFLLRFLRARKFDYDRAFSLLCNYYQLRSDNEEIFRELYPSAVLAALNDGVQYVLPGRTGDGCRVLVLKIGNWQPSVTGGYDMMDIFKVVLLTLEKLIEEDETQVCGMVMIADFTGFSLRHMRYMSAGFVRKLTSLMQDSFPARFKGIHYIREPPLLGVLFNIITPFLKQKVLERLHFHGTNIDALHSYIEPAVLPAEFGGTFRTPISAEEWRDTLLADEDGFRADLMYGYNRVRPGEPAAENVGMGDHGAADTTNSSPPAGTAAREERRDSELEQFAISAYRKLICTQPSGSE